MVTAKDLSNTQYHIKKFFTRKAEGPLCQNALGRTLSMLYITPSYSPEEVREGLFAGDSGCVVAAGSKVLPAPAIFPVRTEFSWAN